MLLKLAMVSRCLSPYFLKNKWLAKLLPCIEIIPKNVWDTKNSEYKIDVKDFSCFKLVLQLQSSRKRAYWRVCTAQSRANGSSGCYCFCFHEEYCTYFKCVPSIKQICFRTRNGNYRCQKIGSILMIGTLEFLESLWWTALCCTDFALQNYPLYNNNEGSSFSERWLSKFKVKKPNKPHPKTSLKF